MKTRSVGHLAKCSGSEPSFCDGCAQDYAIKEERERCEKIMETIRRFVKEQAEDDALWSIRPGVEESYLQQELRRLHRVVETGKYEIPAHLD